MSRLAVFALALVPGVLASSVLYADRTAANEEAGRLTACHAAVAASDRYYSGVLEAGSPEANDTAAAYWAAHAVCVAG